MIILVADRENDFSLRNKIEKAFQILDRYLYWFQTYATKKIKRHRLMKKNRHVFFVFFSISRKKKIS